MNNSCFRRSQRTELSLSEGEIVETFDLARQSWS